MEKRSFITLLVLGWALAGCGGHAPPQVGPGPSPVSPTPDPSATAVAPDGVAGILVMAHGGSEDWNASVEAAVRPLADEVATAIAFGMANPVTLQKAVDELEAAGVGRIAVVRLFLSGESFLHRTEFLLGTREDPPPGSRPHAGSGGHTHGGSDDLRPIRTASRIAIDREGLVEAPETGRILRERALALSRDPSNEVVLILGHGNGDEAVNDRLLAHMEERAEPVRAEGFREVRVETLREDWADAREASEARIRGWVSAHAEGGARPLVVPLRLSGFGPYAEVLAGLSYEAEGLGLVPHDALGAWLRRRASTVLCAHGWTHEALPCPAVAKGERRRGPGGR